MLWSFHPKFALDVKIDDPTQSLRRSITHVMRASRGHRASSQADLKMARRRGKRTGLPFIVIGGGLR